MRWPTWLRVIPHLIERFGGHAMAAGLSLRAEAFPRVRARLPRSAPQPLLTPELLQADVLSDGELRRDEFDRASAEALRDGGPWGQGFPEPQFDGEFEVLGWRVVGERHLKLELGLGGAASQRHRVRRLGWGRLRRRGCASPTAWSPMTTAAARPYSWS